MRRETPEPWAAAMVKAQATTRSGRPSITALARIAGLGVETTRRLLYGMGSASVESVSKVADALHIDVREVSRWAAQSRAVKAPYGVPAEADLLTDRERRAVTDLIRAITDGRRSNAEAQESRQETRSTSEQHETSITRAARGARIAREIGVDPTHDERKRQSGHLAVSPVDDTNDGNKDATDEGLARPNR